MTQNKKWRTRVLNNSNKHIHTHTRTNTLFKFLRIFFFSFIILIITSHISPKMTNRVCGVYLLLCVCAFSWENVVAVVVFALWEIFLMLHLPSFSFVCFLSFFFCFVLFISQETHGTFYCSALSNWRHTDIWQWMGFFSWSFVKIICLL